MSMRIVVRLTVLALALILSAPMAFGQSRVVVDGKIGASEYAKTFKHDASGITLSWTVAGDTIYVGIRAQSEGWIGIGFLSEKTKGKQGADQYIFTVEGGKPVAVDLYQASAAGPPVLDDQNGGKNSILQSAVIRDGGVVVVEFSRKLKTGEKTDMDIVPGKKFFLLLALGTGEAWRSPHKGTARWEISGFAF
ncbi:MAG: DOMON domain-containing protein [bacterium]|nr:DOMON domain-containing protein [bacterium]